MFEAVRSAWIFFPHLKTTLIEAGLFLLCAGVAVVRPSFLQKPLTATEKVFARLALRKKASLLLIGFLPVVLRVTMLPGMPEPQPGQADEFAHLYAAATFAEGRLANPQPPFFRHFESAMLLSSPKFASTYAPAQGMSLALGQLLGDPWIGVLLGVAAMCAAILWMLQAYMPPKWALLGALLAVLQLGVFSYWMNSYYGGALAATGGALVFGAMQRIRKLRQVKLQHAISFIAGAALLANTRPFEGFLMVGFASILLIAGLFSDTQVLGRARTAAITMLVSGGFLIAGWTLFYNSRVTGSALTMPYTVSMREWGGFIWQQRPQSHCDQADLHGYYSVLNRYVAAHRELLPYRWIPAQLIRIATVISAVYISPASLIPFVLGLLAVRRSSPLLYSAIAAVGMIGGMLAYTFVGAHYLAPITSLVLAIVVLGIRVMRTWRIGRRRPGLFLSRAVPVVCILGFCVNYAAGFSGRFRPAPDYFPIRRAHIAEELNATRGKHLVFVRYPEKYNFNEQWVYNAPDIETAHVIWAREINSGSDQELLKYFSDRTVWLVRLENPRLEPEPYTPMPKCSAFLRGSDFCAHSGAETSGTAQSD